MSKAFWAMYLNMAVNNVLTVIQFLERKYALSFDEAFAPFLDDETEDRQIAESRSRIMQSPVIEALKSSTDISLQSNIIRNLIHFFPFLRRIEECREKEMASQLPPNEIKEAKKVMYDQGINIEDHIEYMTAYYGNSAPYLDRSPLGKCYSTAAQTLAFQANNLEEAKKAKLLFQKARDCFKESDDRIRIMVYRGHLACDFYDKNEFLEEWLDVQKELQNLVREPDQWNEYRYVLAVFIKGVLIYGSPAEKREWVDRLNQFFANYSEDQLAYHPWGIIMQIIAMLHESLYMDQENRRNDDLEKINNYYRKAENSLLKGGDLLQLFASITQIRYSLFCSKLTENDVEKSQTLETDLRSFHKKASEYFAGEGIDNPFDESQLSFNSPLAHAEEILKLIRFNYW